MNALRYACVLLALIVITAGALAGELLSFDLPGGKPLPAGWEKLARQAKLEGQVLQIPAGGQVEWKFPVTPEWKIVRVLAEFRVSGLKLGKENWQNARVMVRFDETMQGGKQWYGATPSLSEDSDWQRQEMYSEVPAGAGVLAVVPAVFAEAGTMEIRKLEVEWMGDEGRDRMKIANFMAGTQEMPGGQFINGDFEAGTKGWSGFGDKVQVIERSGNHLLRAASDEAAWAVVSATYRLPEGMRGARISAKVSVKKPGRGAEGYMWPRITTTPLDEKGEHVGGWPSINFENETPEGIYSFDAALPREAKALRIEVGLMNAAGEMEVDDLRIEPLGPGGAPLSLPAALSVAREAQKLNILSSERGEIVLNGLWRFMPAIADVAKQPNDAWGWIWVPGAWNKTHRLPGIAASANSQAWNEFDPETNAAAWYERTFTIPQEWNGRVVLLDLERVSTDAVVYCNGREAGQVKWPGGTVDLTDFAKVGENTLRLLVVATQTEKESANLMGVGAGQVSTVKTELQTRGIIGDVRLSSRPKGAHVSDVFVKTSTRKRQITLDAELAGVTQPGEVLFLARMLDEKGQEEERFEKVVQVQPADLQRLELTFDWPNPRLWDLDRPNLYTLQLSAEGAGLRDEYSQRFGFREFWIGEDDNQQPAAQGQLPNRLKFFLNGTEFRMRPNCWDDSYELTNSMREGAEGYIRGFRSVGFNTAEIWPTRKSERGTLNAREIWMTAADEMGMPLLGAGPDSTSFIVNLANWTFTWDGRKSEYEKSALAEVRKMRNHPSVMVYSTNANFFGHNQDQNPRYIGRRGWTVESQSYSQRQAAGKEALDFIKKLDPTRPVFTHMGGQEFGDISATNHYLCFIPLQEREEWMGYWAQQGNLPYIAIEFGTPLSCSFMRGHMNGGFWGVEPGGAMVSEPQVTEFSAIYLGAKAYQQEMPEYRQLIATKFIKDQLYNVSTDLPLVASPDLLDIEQLFTRNTWRSWRTLGISSMVPWSMAHGWEGTGTDEPVKMPAFEPGRRGAYFATLPSKTVNRLQDPTGRRPNASAATLKEACADTMAWIAGPERLEYQSSPIPDATNAPSAKAAPAFMSKDHNFYGGELLARQVALINDSRSEQPFEYQFTITLAGQTLIASSNRGTLAPSQTRFAPYSNRLPEVQTRQSGRVLLRAKIGGQEQTDEFTFTVFPKLPAATDITVSIYDPQGETAALLTRLGVKLLPWDEHTATAPGAQKRSVLVIGRNAMAKGSLPDELVETLKRGTNVLIMGQDPQYARDSLGLRINRQASRRVFTLPRSHPITQGLSADDLRDWRGEGTLVEPYPPTESMTDEAPYGWKWGNRGTVSSAAIEKPHHSAWTPILECEFDLAYSPLLEMNLGSGTAMLCTLDLEGRTAADPVADLLARRIVEYLAARTAKRTSTAYMGDGSRKALLQSMGVRFETLDPMKAQVILADRGADSAALRKAAEGGATVIVLPQTAISDLAPLQWIKGAYPASDVPDRAELAGLSQSDLHWRVPCDAMLLTEKPGMDLIAGGQLGIEKVGQGQIIYAQLDPERYNADVITYYRFTRWRQTRALAQVLANAGVAFEMDERVLKPSRINDGAIPLAGEWQGRITRKEQPVPDGVIPDKGISELAIQSVGTEGVPETGWQTVQLPGLWEGYGGQWADFDGEAVFRRTVEIPEELAGKELTLNLGPLDDFDSTYWDGELVGSVGIDVPQFYSLPRQYPLRPEQTKAGKHVLAIRIFDHKGGGGFNGTAKAMVLQAPRKESLGLYYPDFREDHSLGDDPARYKRW